MFITGKSIPRRTFLRGMGTAAVALPFLDAMAPAFAATPPPPVRLACLYVPNGIDMKNWSLELGMDDSRQAGDCDSGYSCAYTNNLAWKSETQPLPPTLDPRVLFERLFGTGVVLSPEAKERQARYRRSILDFVTGDAKKLQSS